MELFFYILFTWVGCGEDADCDFSDCEYCTSSGRRKRYDSEYCDAIECGIGDGDCDGDRECSAGLICGKNNFLDHHPLLSHCAIRRREVCVHPGIP